MPVPCSTFGGPCDGLVFQTPSVYTELHIFVGEIIDTGDCLAIPHPLSPFPIDGFTAYSFTLIDESGQHVYTPSHEHSIN